MKIGTDSIMFSRWVDVAQDDVVLDVGTGCGLIAMMLAQKGVQHVDAVEIDHDSCVEAGENFSCTPWAKMLNIIESDVRLFAQKTTQRYDLIVSNPPYFVDFPKSQSQRKVMARHADSLAYSELVDVAKTLLRPSGRLALVLPAIESKIFVEKAQEKGFFLQKEQRIIPVEGREYNRVNMQFVLTSCAVETEYFTIRKPDHSFTDEYHEYLKDYYLW